MGKYNNKLVLKALIKGDFDTLNEILDSGFDFQTKTGKENWSLLHQAFINPIFRVPTKSVEFLLNTGIAINGIDIYGNTPLHYAARTKNIDAIKALISHGADVNFFNNEGRNVLTEYLQQRPFDRETIKLLLGSGSTPTIDGNADKFANYIQSISHGNDAWLYQLFSKN